MKGRFSGFLSLVCIIILIVSSCAALANSWPTPTASANAGPDQVVDVNTVVNFDGSGSSGEGELEYTWYFRDGTVITEDVDVSSFDEDSVYIFKLSTNLTGVSNARAVFLRFKRLGGHANDTYPSTFDVFGANLVRV